MLLNLVTLFVALVVTGLPLLRLELPSLTGPIHASGADERWSVKVLLPLILMAGVSVPFFLPDLYENVLLEAVPTSDLRAVTAISLGTCAAVLISAIIHIRTSVPYALVGAILGCRLMVDGTMDWAFIAGIAGTWIAAPLVCLGLSALFTKLFLLYSSKSGRHLAIVDHRLLLGCVLGALLLAVTAVWNNAAVCSLFPQLILGNTPVGAGFTAGVLLLILLTSLPFLRSRTDNMAGRSLDFGSAHVLAILLSMALVLGVCSLPVLHRICLVPAPLSLNCLLLGALIGGSLVRRQAAINQETILKSTAASVTAPILGFLMSYCFSMILGVSSRSATLIPILILLGVLAISVGLYIYIRADRREENRRQMIRSRQEQVYSTQKSLSALEVRVETNEKELLNKLDIKRKELVDFAVGVSEQKAFMEKVYDKLSKARALPDGPAKDQALETLLKDLRERMYFTREMNDFYARSEVLHRDFNMRLKESYPSLTESERKLANLLRQGFSSKYIASLMNITPKSVEISRYRLRNKLGLSRSDNLVQFIKSI